MSEVGAECQCQVPPGRRLLLNEPKCVAAAALETKYPHFSNTAPEAL